MFLTQSMKPLASSLNHVKVGTKIIDFAHAVASSKLAEIRILHMDLTDTKEKAIIDQMLGIFQTNSPFYELKWYQM